MEEIKRIVTDLDINGKRAKMLLNEARLLRIHRDMSNLAFNLPVARCAYLLDQLDYEIREAGRYPFNWILDDNYDCIRPYRILIKET